LPPTWPGFPARAALCKALERIPSKAPPRGKQAGTGEGWASPMNPAAARSWRRVAPVAMAPAPSGTIEGKAPTWHGLPGRAKLSPKLQPPTIRNAGGQVPGIRFCPKRKKKRQRRKASEARQARRAPPCGQGSAGMGACGQPVSGPGAAQNPARVVHMCPCRAFLSIRPRAWAAP